MGSVRDAASNAESIIELYREFHRIAGVCNSRWGGVAVRWYFRGADKATYSLDPGLLRWPSLGKDMEALEYNKAADFIARGWPHIPKDARTAWELMFLMQHHGVATRLLDWTESLACAGYFATRDIREESDGAVWMLVTPFLVERALGHTGTHLGADHPHLGAFKLASHESGRRDLVAFNAKCPLPLMPQHVTSRIIAQRGRFTVHTFEVGALEKLGEEDRAAHGEACFLHQIIIPGRAKGVLRQQVRIMGGACEEDLFPDLDGLARSMRWEEEETAIDAGHVRP